MTSFMLGMNKILLSTHLYPIKMVQSRESTSLEESVPYMSSYSHVELSTDDDAEDGKTHLSSREKATGPRSHIKRILTGIMLLFIALGTMGLIRGGTGRGATEVEQKRCGSNPTEARENGCHFEPMLTAWVPSECYSGDLVEEYQQDYGDIYETWPWYSDSNITQRITGADLDPLRAGNFSIIYTPFQASHDLHCLYTWRKVTTALGQKIKVVDARSAQTYHATHCAQHITHRLHQKDYDMQEKWAFPLLFHDCVPVAGD